MIAATSKASTSPEPLITAEVTALEAEFDATGTFTVVRGLRPRAPALPRPPHRDLHAGHGVRRGEEGRAARRARRWARSTPTSTVFDHVSQGGVSDWEFLDGLAREIGHEVAVKDGKFEFRAPKPAKDAPAPTSDQAEPLLLRQGTDLVRFRSVVTSAEQVKEVQVRGWDVARKTALVGTAPAKTESAQLSGPGVAPPELAKTFGDPVYVATDVPYRGQSEVDAAAKALSEQIAGAFAEFEGTARGNPKIRAGTAIAIDNLGRAVRRQVRGHLLAARLRPDHRLHHALRRHRPPGAVAVRARLRRRGVAAGDDRRRDRAGQRRARPPAPGPGEADLPVAVRRLRQRLGAHRARRRRQGPRVLRAARGRRRGAGRLRAGRHPAAVRGRRAVQRRRHAQAGPDRRRRRRLRRDQPPVAGVAPRAPDRPARPGRPQGGHRARDRRRQAHVHPRRHGQQPSRCTATAA